MISGNTAQQIVDTVRDVCGYDVNYIDTNGMILASTDQERIGTYHEVGHQAARTAKTIEVYEDEKYTGTRRGVNIPFRYHGQVIGVVGITGEPETVRAYAHLTLRIIRLLLRERDLDTSRELKRAEYSYVAKALVSNDAIDEAYLEQFLKQYGLSVKDRFRVILVQIHLTDRSENITMAEALAEEQLQRLKNSFFGYDYPSRYILIMKEETFQNSLPQLRKEIHEPMRAAIGSECTLQGISRSFQNAMLAMASGQGPIHEFDSLYLALLYSGLSSSVRDAFLSRTVFGLCEKEIRILRTYYACDMSLKKSAEQLFVHINTLQYQLDRIHEKSGLNPRRFKDAVILETALSLSDMPRR